VCEIDVGGGVWRIKTHKDNNKIAVAAMQGNFKILEYFPEIGKFELKETYDEVHKSLGYGIDWMPGDSNLLASASFYDSLLSLWCLS